MPPGYGRHGDAFFPLIILFWLLVCTCLCPGVAESIKFTKSNIPAILKSSMNMKMTRLPSTPSAEPFSGPDAVLLLDGGTGEELFRRGVPDDRRIWSATAVVKDTYHPVLKEVHQSFLRAGAQAITTNSYGLVPGVGFTKDDLAVHGATAARLARQAVEEEEEQEQQQSSPSDYAASPSSSSSSLPRRYVLGSLGPLVESYRPDLIMSPEEGIPYYEILVRAMWDQVDAFLAETMSCVEESMQALQAVHQVQLEQEEREEHHRVRPCMVSYTLNEQGHLRSGESVLTAIPRILQYAREHSIRVWAILFNCSGPEAISQALQRIKSDEEVLRQLAGAGTALGAYANRLTPVAADWTMASSRGPQPMRSDLNPEQYYRDFVHPWITQLGVRVVGGCCGITPEHIAFISQRLQGDAAS